MIVQKKRNGDKTAITFWIPKKDAERFRKCAKTEHRTLTAFLWLAGVERCHEIESEDQK